MKTEVLLIRAQADNPNHNLWLNNGTWSVAFTVHLPDNTKKRIRQSLGTKQAALARQRRDELFARYRTKDGTTEIRLAPTPFSAARFGVPVRSATEGNFADPNSPTSDSPNQQVCQKRNFLTAPNSEVLVEKNPRPKVSPAADSPY